MVVANLTGERVFRLTDTPGFQESVGFHRPEVFSSSMNTRNTQFHSGVTYVDGQEIGDWQISGESIVCKHDIVVANSDDNDRVCWGPLQTPKVTITRIKSIPGVPHERPPTWASPLSLFEAGMANRTFIEQKCERDEDGARCELVDPSRRVPQTQTGSHYSHITIKI